MIIKTTETLKECNLRDLGGIETQDGRFLKKNQLFRSEHLVEMAPDVLDDIVKLYRIRSIIDLRTDEEVRKYKRYNTVSLGKINYFQLPLLCENIIVDSDLKKSRNYDGYEYLYYHLLRNERSVFKRGIEIVSDTNNRPVLFHCIAGKDRTGIFAAIMQLILGIPKRHIITDYLKTPRAQEKNIMHLFNLLEEYGGIQGYIEYMKIDDIIIDQLLNSLLY
jgi:protein-tyrosine phosphatase